MACCSPWGRKELDMTERLNSNIPRSGIAGSYGASIVSFFDKPPYCLPQWLHQFAFPPTE